MMEIFIARSDERYLFPLPLFSARIGRPAKSVMKAAIIRISSLMVNLCFYPLATISFRFFRGERKYKTQGMGNGLRTDNPRKGKRNCRKRTQTFFFSFGLFSIFLPYRRTQEEGIKTLQFSSQTISPFFVPPQPDSFHLFLVPNCQAGIKKRRKQGTKIDLKCLESGQRI